MSQAPWNTETISQYKEIDKQALLSDEQTLAFFSQDFGKICSSRPAAVCIPKNTKQIQSLIQYAHQNKIPVTIRGKGLSQGGQSLTIEGGLILSMQHFTKTLDLDKDSIWVEANSTWADLLKISLRKKMAPYVVPYNCNLSIGGVISVGGVGASSFKYGSISAHVLALEVIDGQGTIQIVDKNSSLFHACLSGQGRFGIITKACIALRPIQENIKTCSLVYTDQNQWLQDVLSIKSSVDYMELFCSPAVVGTQLKDGQRIPIVEWLYTLHVSVEYENKQSQLDSIVSKLNPFKVLASQDEEIDSYFLRHNSRFDMMKKSGQWDLVHPWYECFTPTSVIKEYLSYLLNQLPVYYANLVHIVPIDIRKAGFLMYPDSDSVCSFMILNPGVPDSLKDNCLQTVKNLDTFLLNHGGKRYTSGYLGQDLTKDYWSKHFGTDYESWVYLKKQYDPAGIFVSLLHNLE